MEKFQLNTSRLILTAVGMNDVEDIHHLHSLKGTDQYNTLGIPETIRSTTSLVKDWTEQQYAVPRKSYIFCIRLEGTKQFVGSIALLPGKPNFKTAETWYKILPEFWRRGFAKEALMEILRFGFNELLLHRIEAGCAVENIASVKLLEKTGFLKEGRKRKILPIRGNWVDNYFYAILEEDFFHLQDKQK